MRKLGLSIFLLSAVLILLIRISWEKTNELSLKNGQEISIETILYTSPQAEGKFQRFTLHPSRLPRISVLTARYPQYNYGDKIRVSGKIRQRILHKNNRQTVLYSLLYPRIEPAQAQTNPLLMLAASFRKQVSTAFHFLLPETLSSLLLGIVFGIKEQMPNEFKLALQSGGVMHVIAASGMNVTMVAGAMMGILGRLLSRRLAISLSLLGIFFYAILSGLEASIVRASLMGGLVFTASLLGRQNTAVLTLFLTAYAMLFYNPGYLTDVGFQLSFLATLGILLIKPLLLFPEKWQSAWMEDLQTTLAAQIATFPVILATFGQFGLLSVLVNALVLWTIPPLMVLGALAAFASLLNTFFALPFLYLALPLLWFFVTVVTWFGGLNWNLQAASFTWPLITSYYLLLGAMILILRKKRL